MSYLIAAAVGLLVGAHIATWGMFKDSIHEGFTLRRYGRSYLLGLLLGPTVVAVAGLDPTTASGLVVLFGVVYAMERAVNEFYKTFIRVEDQSKYFIPTQFHVLGRVVHGRGRRLALGMGVVAVGLLLLMAVRWLESPAAGGPGWLELVLVGSLGGWFVAALGAWKDAPLEGFQPLKFLRSPAVALAWALLLSRLTESYPLMALGGVGMSVATLETYKTFFFPNSPRGKFSGKPVLHPEMLTRRMRYVPLYVGVWTWVLAMWAAALLPMGILS